MSSNIDSSKIGLKIDMRAILCEAKFHVFKETEEIQRQTKALGLDVSEDLELVLEELSQHIREYASEIKEVLIAECARHSIELIDENKCSYDFPDVWMDLVTCKKCLFQWDGNAQHICD